MMARFADGKPYDPESAIGVLAGRLKPAAALAMIVAEWDEDRTENGIIVAALAEAVISLEDDVEALGELMFEWTQQLYAASAAGTTSAAARG